MRRQDFTSKVHLSLLLCSILYFGSAFGNYGDPFASLMVHSQTGFNGDSLIVKGLYKMGDCVEFAPELQPDPIYAAFNNRTVSVELAPGVCVRLFENSCAAGPSGGRYYDLYPWSPVGVNLAFQNFAGIVSGIGLIACETVVYDNASFTGAAFTIMNLKVIGDCVEAGPSEAFYAFNDRVRSIQLPPRACVRVYEHGCGLGSSLDITKNSPLAKDPGDVFRNDISAIQLIACPARKRIRLYAENNFHGDSLALPDLYNVGDLTVLWDLTLVPWFVQRANSIFLPPQTCVKLIDDQAGDVLETCSGSLWKRNLSSASFGNRVSSIELI